MSEAKPNPIRLLYELQHQDIANRKTINEQELDPHMALLRQWQVERLKKTYVDFLNDKQFRPVCLFFLSDIYGPSDFSQRDHDAEHLYAVLSRYLPKYMLRLLSDTLELNHLSNKLDCTLLQVLTQEFSVTDIITPEVYVQGYRLCDNYSERLDHINLLVKTMQEVGEGAKRNLVGVTLKLARRPAQRAGWHDLYDFLARGYIACKPMREIKTFVDAIQQRETTIIERIFTNHPDPFFLEGKP